jgi:hypothetical protein
MTEDILKYYGSDQSQNGVPFRLNQNNELVSTSGLVPSDQVLENIIFYKVERTPYSTQVAGKIDIVNFSNPSTPVAISSINLSTYGGINSVVAHDSIIACAIESVPAQNNGKVVFFDYNDKLLDMLNL